MLHLQKISQPLCAVCLISLACGEVSGQTAHLDDTASDPVQEILDTLTVRSAERENAIKALLESMPDDPRRHMLRYYLVDIQSARAQDPSKEPGHFFDPPDTTSILEVVDQFDQITEEIDAPGEVRFRAGWGAATLLQTYTQQTDQVFSRYKALSRSDYAAGEGLERQYWRNRSLLEAARSAFAMGNDISGENILAEVLSYHYLGMADRKMYRNFYELHQDGLRLYLRVFSGNPQKLMNLEIYPSHPEQLRERRKLLEQQLPVSEEQRLVFFDEAIGMIDTVKDKGPGSDDNHVAYTSGGKGQAQSTNHSASG